MIFAWLVHLYTASGAVMAFLALLAVGAGDYRTAFLWLFAATVVDSTDGWLARAARVQERLPWFSGAHMDDVIDYLTFVFVPAVLLYRSRAVPDGWGLFVVSAILLASAYGFGQVDAKTRDHFFTGFPSYWNIVAFYLHAADMSQAVNAAILLALCVMVFVPIGYVYPSRTPAMRTLTVALCSGWGVMILALIWQLPAVSGELLALSLVLPIYYAGLSLVLHTRRQDGRR